MSNELDKLKEKLTGLAEEIARTYRIKLDYSNDSIRHVEEILGEAHNQYVRTGSNDNLRGVAFAFGAYIVKVVEKEFPNVRWETDHPEMGETTFPLYFDEKNVIFPFAWCQKRILEGPEDNVWNKYKYFVLKHTSPDEVGKSFLKRTFGG